MEQDKEVTTAKTVQSVSGWDPLEYLQSRNPTGDCLRRVRKDLKTLFKDPLPGIYAVPDNIHATLIHSIIVGPFGTPYEGGFFYFIINCPDNYPHEPPKVKLMTTGGGRVRFNPNLYTNGKVCLSILGTWSGPGWSIVQSLSSILLSIQSLMNENPFHNEPGHETAEFRVVSNYNECVRHETLRAAVIEMVDKNTSMHQSLPVELQDIVRSLFPGFVESYSITCSTNIHKDGQPFVDPFREMRGQFSYALMLDTLRELEVSLLDADMSEMAEDERLADDDGDDHECDVNVNAGVNNDVDADGGEGKGKGTG